MKRNPSPNYSLSIAVQENALRVMWLSRGMPGSASGEPGAAAEAFSAPALVSAIGALMQQVRLLLFSAPTFFPEVWCAGLGLPPPAPRWNLHRAEIQRLDLEKSLENRRRLTNSTKVAEMKRIP